MKKTKLILDLDGVLITTPLWKTDEIDLDGYSSFNKECVSNLNELLASAEFEMWLSSTRRTQKTIDEFNRIFEFRNIKQPIFGFLPEYEGCKSRKEEIEKFIAKEKLSSYLIIDDDKSLTELPQDMAGKLVLTELMKGFNKEKLTEAIEKLKRK